MNPLFPDFTTAAGVGALAGLGAECVTAFENKGKFMGYITVTALVVQAVSCVFGKGAALGVFGAFAVAALGRFWEPKQQKPTPLVQCFGVALLGGLAGYYSEPYAHHLMVAIRIN